MMFSRNIMDNEYWNGSFILICVDMDFFSLKSSEWKKINPMNENFWKKANPVVFTRKWFISFSFALKPDTLPISSEPVGKLTTKHLNHNYSTFYLPILISVDLCNRLQ